MTDDYTPDTVRALIAALIDTNKSLCETNKILAEKLSNSGNAHVHTPANVYTPANRKRETSVTKLRDVEVEILKFYASAGKPVGITREDLRKCLKRRRQDVAAVFDLLYKKKCLWKKAAGYVITKAGQRRLVELLQQQEAEHEMLEHALDEARPAAIAVESDNASTSADDGETESDAATDGILIQPIVSQAPGQVKSVDATLDVLCSNYSTEGWTRERVLAGVETEKTLTLDGEMIRFNA